MNLTKKQKQIAAVLSTAVFLCLYIFTTNPQQLTAPFLLVPPLAVFVFCLVLFRFVSGFLGAVQNTHTKAVVIALSALPALLMMLAAVGQLGLKDLALTVLFIGGLTWYFERTKEQAF